MDLRAARGERPHEVRGLGRDVEAGADAEAREGLLALEALADQAQDGHLALGPLDPPDALGGEGEVGDVVGRRAGGFGHRGPRGRGRPIGGPTGRAIGGLTGWAWSWSAGSCARRAAAEQASEGRGEVRPGRGRAADEALLEPAVLLVAEPAVGGDGGRVVRADVEDDLVARTAAAPR